MSCFAGIKVLELGSTIAGPFAARLLADFGATVIKVEAPQGDVVRSMGMEKDGISLYAASMMRNKHNIALDLRKPDAREIARRLASSMDVVIENFRPGTLEKWGLDYPTLSSDNPGLILARVSGYGQDGPYASRPGYGINGEAMSGLRALNGDPDRPPPRIATSLTDYIAGTYTAFGIAAALYHRGITGRGQVIDTALYESAMSYTEPHIPAFDALGIEAQRAGSRLPNSTPNNLFAARDGFVHIAAFADATFRRLANVMGQPELADDPRFSTARARNSNIEELEHIISKWTLTHKAEALEQQLIGADVPASRIYGIGDLFKDAHVHARGALQNVDHPKLGELVVTGIVPRLSETQGNVEWLGREIGTDSADILRRFAACSDDEISALEASGAVQLAAKPEQKPADTPTSNSPESA